MNTTHHVQSNLKSQAGMTLIEVLIYIVITSIIVIIAGQTFVDTAKFSFRVKNTTGAGMEANEALVYVSEDLTRTGAKRYENGSAEVPLSWVYLDPANSIDSLKDSSSFHLVKSAGQFDSLMIRAGDYSGAGVITNVASIQYFVKGDTLIRERLDYPVTYSSSSMNVASSASSTKEILATNVTQFKVDLGVSQVTSTDTLYNPTTFGAAGITEIGSLATIASDGAFAKVTAMNLADTGISTSRETRKFVLNQFDPSGTASVLNQNFEAGKVYQVYFSTQFSTEFIDNFKAFGAAADTLEMRIVSSTSTCAQSTQVPRYFFYPGDANLNARRFEFSPQSDLTNVGICFIFSTAHSGWKAATASLSVGNVKIFRTNPGEYTWQTLTPSIADKNHTKAFRLSFKVTKGGQERPFTRIIPIPNNGK